MTSDPKTTVASSGADYARGTGQPDFRIMLPALAIILAVAVPLAFNPTLGAEMVKASHTFITRYFGWLFMLTPPICLGILIWLSVSRYGKIKLGRPDEKPEFSYFSWVAMLFCCGVGSSIIVWGVAEPIYYLTDPPLGVAKNSREAYEFAITLPQFHWGVSAWSIYALASLAIAYSVFVLRAPQLRLSTACEGAIGPRSKRWPGCVLEILVVIGSVGGYGTSLGLGVPLVSTFFSELFGIPDSLYLQLFVVTLWTMIFSLSVFKGLAKGMRKLSSLNIWLVLLILAFIFAVGPTMFILEMWVTSLGRLFNNFPSLSFSLEPLNYAVNSDTGRWSRQAGFPQNWTVFYWCWWVALAPVTGLFLGRISRGRTIRETAWGIVVWGSLGCSLTLAIIGGYSLYLQYTGALDITALLTQRGAGATAALVLATLPAAKIMIPLYALMAMIFLATTLDAASITLSSICTKELYGHQQPALWHRLLWALTLGFFSIGLLITGGDQALRTVQTSSVAAGLPLLFALAALGWSFLRNLSQRGLPGAAGSSGKRE